MHPTNQYTAREQVVASFFEALLGVSAEEKPPSVLCMSKAAKVPVLFSGSRPLNLHRVTFSFIKSCSDSPRQYVKPRQLNGYRSFSKVDAQFFFFFILF